MANVKDFYESAGVIHAPDCQLCDIEPVIPLEQPSKLRTATDIMLLLLIGAVMLVTAFRPDWIIGGIGK